MVQNAEKVFGLGFDEVISLGFDYSRESVENLEKINKLIKDKLIPIINIVFKKSEKEKINREFKKVIGTRNNLIRIISYLKTVTRYSRRVWYG